MTRRQAATGGPLKQHHGGPRRPVRRGVRHSLRGASWCQCGGQGAASTAVRRGPRQSPFVTDLQRWIMANGREPFPAALAVWESGGLRQHAPAMPSSTPAHAAAATGDDASGDGQRPSLELCDAGPRRARRAAATKPMPTTAVTDGLGAHRSAATAMPGGAVRCGSDACPGAVGDGSGAVFSKVASMAGTKAAMSWGPLLVVRFPSRTIS